MDKQIENRSTARQVVEALRKGIPPQRGVDLYSVGNEKLIEGIRKHHLGGIEHQGLIRFISGSWGAGKTHFFRLLREVAFQNGCLVSNVELNVNDAALNRFERIFYSIVRNVATPSVFGTETYSDIAPFGGVLREALAFLNSGRHEQPAEVTHEQYTKAAEALAADHRVDIDFKKMIQKYWETFLPEDGDVAIQEQIRSEILQWFSGEGQLSDLRRRFGINKMVNKENAKLMLQSLAGFVRLAGYKGLLILFDEAEQAYSVMRKSQLRDAQNNLLSLINNVSVLEGLFLIYATTPDFFTDPKHGIVAYGALAQRIGKPDERPPRSLDLIWNLDMVTTSLADYQEAATKILGIYAAAYPEARGQLPSADDVRARVASLDRIHPSMSAVRFWRVLVTAIIALLDDCLEEGQTRSTEAVYDDVMSLLREA